MDSRGFTLAETAVIVVVVGILAAIAGPSFIGLMNKKQVDDALTRVQGALAEAQRQAIRRSQSCTVTIPEGNNSTLTATPTGCLVTGDRELDDINVDNLASTGDLAVNFSFRGNTSGFDDGTIILSKSATSDYKRCLVVSVGIGIMRTGDYTNGACVTRQI